MHFFKFDLERSKVTRRSYEYRGIHTHDWTPYIILAVFFNCPIAWNKSYKHLIIEMHVKNLNFDDL